MLRRPRTLAIKPKSSSNFILYKFYRTKNAHPFSLLQGKAPLKNGRPLSTNRNFQGLNFQHMRFSSDVPCPDCNKLQSKIDSLENAINKKIDKEDLENVEKGFKSEFSKKSNISEVDILEGKVKKVEKELSTKTEKLNELGKSLHINESKVSRLYKGLSSLGAR